MDALRFAATLAAELVPLFLLVSTLVYLVVERVTPDRIRSVLGGRSRWIGVPLSAVIGALTPFCSCSTVPMVNGMRSAGIPVASLIAFLIASPLINPVAVALLGTAVGLQYAVLYTVAGIGFAMGAGVVVERWYAGPVAAPVAFAGVPERPACASSACAAPACAPAPGAALAFATAGGGGLAVLSVPRDVSSAVPRSVRVAGPLADALRAAFTRALGDLRKLWLALALAIAVGAAIHGYVPAELLASVAGPDRPWAIPAAAVLGVPVYASVVVLLPLGTSLLAKGVGIGAVTAFLMGASGFSLPEGIMLARILPRGLLLRVLAVFCAGVVLIGYGFQWAVG
jgi:uncharacterized protein